MSEELNIHTHGPIGHISLKRPKALHALNLDMSVAIAEALLSWRENPDIMGVMIDHAEGRGFCAGGDVVSIRQSVLEDGGRHGREFFFAEYRLTHLLFTYPKPILTFMDGVTMGGGVGLALPARYRVATEKTLFAMPEGDIGLFPDIGSGWTLPRLPGRIGIFLALTGARLDGAECLWAGLATHYLPSDRLAEMKASLTANPGTAAQLLKHYSAEPPAARLATNAEKIDHLFASNKLEDIIAALEKDPSEWAAKELQTILRKSPQSSKVALRLLAEGPSRKDFADEMEVEYRLAARSIMRPDFAEGVRAVLVDKDNQPAWSPARPEDVDEELLDSLFAPLPENERWSPFPALL
ncbi:enoyl-CoA hydratase/isomerase family protein [Altericroceibacterium spongiae]|uniref:3-hydroxyisobutyryl-CoA hydrolase n=1 Tax=Altericroceibacterium spongiae TaxID=2320269 RepID=A0A420EBY6_9SPHN|nr:enoyl-CoA hydratase/isomerase family protein [Altericroceibacterium spongiae]RKF18174.1 enoyl-CoA hydratase/isomerase family protein [Altericroceibacterium spongiae]